MLDLATPLDQFPGVRPDRARVLSRLGLHTVGDLVGHFPRDHQDRREITPIDALVDRRFAVIRGTVVESTLRSGHGRRFVVTTQIQDATGTLVAEFWQQRFRLEQLRPGREVLLAGRVTIDLGGPKMSGPEVDTGPSDERESIHAGRIVPIHALTRGIAAPTLRSLVWRALEQLPEDLVDPLPASIREQRALLDYATAARTAHFPTDYAQLDAAQHRLKYEEFFVLQIALGLRRHLQRIERKPHRVEVDTVLDQRIRARFPFTLTGAQDRVVGEIVGDLAREQPMNRLLQGDVGSGKTVVAAYAMLAAVARGLQVALLAPTEILAEQHMRTLRRFLAGSEVRLALISGGGGAAERREVREALERGEIDIAVGTHALFQESVAFRQLGLVVVDEQHKFGVLQRAALREKGLSPDLLVMSATPIPRTLTMTLFGDLDVSVIDELPPGRQPVDTRVCAERQRESAYAWVRQQAEAGHGVYIVVPLVEPSEELPLRDATTFADELRAGPLRGLAVGLLHGKLPPAEKEAAMAAFESGETPVLVATTVIEVGVDVPEATVLVVENAERFGLAQLHQLRGRIGRGTHSSRMLLFHGKLTKQARARLTALRSTTDGFRIAEDDLRIRGPGEFLGTRQSGLPEFKLAQLAGDGLLLAQAREDALELVRGNPRLTGEAEPLRDTLRARYGQVLRLLRS